MARVLVTRPEPGASRTAARLAGAGHEPIVAPLLAVHAQPWAMPGGEWEAVAFTSAHAPAAAGEAATALRALPAWCVGERTAQAARRAGWGDVRLSGPDAAGLLAAAAGAGVTRLLHLAARERTDAVPPPGLTIGVAVVYAAEAAEALPLHAAAAIADGQIEWVLLLSARTAITFARLVDRGGLPRDGLRLAAIAPHVLAAAGSGWAGGVAAAEPTEAAVLAAAGLLCQDVRRGSKGGEAD